MAAVSSALSAEGGWRARPKTGARGKGRALLIRLAVAAVVVALLGFVGIRIFRTRSDEVKKPQVPVQAAQSRSGVAAGPAPISASASSRPAVGEAESRFTSRENRPGARATVALGMPYAARESSPVANARAGILQRELIRQALLIAARDELGLLTRDDVLGERQNAQAPASSGPEIQTISGPNGLIRVVIKQAEGGDADTAGRSRFDQETRRHCQLGRQRPESRRPGQSGPAD